MRDGRIDIKANPARTYIASLGAFFLRSVIGIGNSYGQPQSKTARSPLLGFSFGHELSVKAA
jgi:hypothetical protein